MHLVRYLLAKFTMEKLKVRFLWASAWFGVQQLYNNIFLNIYIFIISYYIILYYIMASILSKQLTQSVPSTSSSSSFCGFTMLCQWETCGLTSAGPLAHSLPKTQDTGWMTVYLLCSVWSGDCKSVQRLLTICRMNEWKRNGRSIVLAHNLSSTNCHSFIHSWCIQ